MVYVATDLKGVTGMKIAVISDIHGNLPALEAVLNDINKRNVDKIICLGDIIGKGSHAKEAVEICREECDIVIKGNWEDYICKKYMELKHGKADGLIDSLLWCINSVTDEQMEYLSASPHSTELYLSGNLVRLFHAHPRNFNRYYADSPLEKRMELFDYSEDSEIRQPADIAVYADIHVAYLQAGMGKQLLNVGSVGNPLDITKASYAILEGGESKDVNFSAQFIRVSYDIDMAVSMAKERNVPHLDGYISELRTAKYFARPSI